MGARFTMRMAGPDIVLFVAGALLFGGASFAIVQQGGLGALGEETSALGAFDVTFETRRAEIETQDVASFRSAELTFDVNATNVATAFIVVECTDSQVSSASPFTIEVTVTPAGNATGATSTGNCGSPIEITIPVAEVPAATRASGTTESEARANFPASENATAAAGAWTVTLSGARSGPTGPIPGQVPAPAPSGTVRFEVEQWEPRFSAVQGK